MKYISLGANYSILPMCMNNMKLALKRIGEANLFNISLWRVRKNRASNVMPLSDNQLIKLGILNVKKQLNRNLGKNGKFTGRMIRKTASIKQNQSDDSNELITTFPRNDVIRIVIATYNLLYAIDANCCTKLLEVVESDDYNGKELNRNLQTRTIWPIQSNIIIRSVGKTKEDKAVINSLKDIVMRRL